MTIVHPLDPATVLKHGSHHSPDQGMCAMEAAAYMAGEPFTDHPACVSPVIGAFMRAWNDALPDDATRTSLLGPLVPLTIGTKTTAEDEERRAWLATDWLVRVHAPAWLRLAGLTEQADLLAGMVELTAGTTPSLLAPIRAARAAAAAAGAAAWDAAWDAARDAAWAAAGAAAWDAAWDAARDAARDALAPTTATLQASAAELVEAMCQIGRDRG